MMNDSCQRFIFVDQDIRGEIVHLGDSFQTLQSNKTYPGPVVVQLGEFLAAGVLLSTTIKYQGRLVLQARSQGQLPLIMAECTHDQCVRGIARYDDPPAGSSFRELLQGGTLAITIEPEKGESYQGIVALEDESLAASLESYFARSEQLPSLFFLASEQNRCAGLMLQQMPPGRVLSQQDRAGAWSTVSQLAATLGRQELLDLDNETLLFRLFNQMEVKIFTPRSVRHRCSCNRERTARALFLLGRDEIMEIVTEQGGVEIGCEFCGKQYNFGPHELDLLFEHPDSENVH
ncbi:MAG: Hsp33 family molecular chaperone HslO [Pseudohongiellaceae bacterium]